MDNFPRCFSLWVLLALPLLAQESDPAQLWRSYEERRLALAAGDLPAHLALAHWCQLEGLAGESHLLARAILRLDPSHEEAHRMLGHSQQDGRWGLDAKALEAAGQVRFRGRWRTLPEIQALRAAEAMAQRDRDIRREVGRMAQKLGTKSDFDRARARDDLLAYLDREGLAHLAPNVHRLHDRAADHWARVRESEVLWAETRLQHSTLTRLRPFQTSLGFGSPVTLELPEVRTVTLGTTVGIPVR